jgi:hypothetical protein
MALHVRPTRTVNKQSQCANGTAYQYTTVQLSAWVLQLCRFTALILDPACMNIMTGILVCWIPFSCAIKSVPGLWLPGNTYYALPPEADRNSTLMPIFSMLSIARNK